MNGFNMDLPLPPKYSPQAAWAVQMDLLDQPQMYASLPTEPGQDQKAKSQDKQAIENMMNKELSSHDQSIQQQRFLQFPHAQKKDVNYFLAELAGQKTLSPAQKNLVVQNLVRKNQIKQAKLKQLAEMQQKEHLHFQAMNKNINFQSNITQDKSGNFITKPIDVKKVKFNEAYSGQHSGHWKSPSQNEQLIQYNFKSSDLHRNQFIMMNEPSLSIMGPSGMDIFNKSPNATRFQSNSPLAINSIMQPRNLVIQNQQIGQSEGNFKKIHGTSKSKHIKLPQKFRNEGGQESSTVAKIPSSNAPPKIDETAEENDQPTDRARVNDIHGQLIFGSTHSFVDTNEGTKQQISQRFSLNSKGQDFIDHQTAEARRVRKQTLPLEEDTSPKSNKNKIYESTSHHVSEAEAAKEETAEDLASMKYNSHGHKKENDDVDKKPISSHNKLSDNASSQVSQPYQLTSKNAILPQVKPNLSPSRANDETLLNNTYLRSENDQKTGNIQSGGNQVNANSALLEGQIDVKVNDFQKIFNAESPIPQIKTDAKVPSKPNPTKDRKLQQILGKIQDVQFRNHRLDAKNSKDSKIKDTIQENAYVPTDGTFIKSGNTTPGKTTPFLMSFPKVQTIEVTTQKQFGHLMTQVNSNAQNSSQGNQFEQYSILKHQTEQRVSPVVESQISLNKNENDFGNEISPTMKVRQTGAQTSQYRQQMIQSIDQQAHTGDQFFKIRNQIPKTAEQGKRRNKSNDPKQTQVFKFGSQFPFSVVSPMSQQKPRNGQKQTAEITLRNSQQNFQPLSGGSQFSPVSDNLKPQIRYPPGTAGNPMGGGGLTQRSPRVNTQRGNHTGSKGRMNFGKAPQRSFHKVNKNRGRDKFYSIKSQNEGNQTSMGKNSVGMKMTESIYSDLKAGPVTDRNSHFNELNSLMMSINQGDKLINNSLENRFEIREIRQKLMSRDGGAGLDSKGVPYLIKQAHNESLYKTNHGQKLRQDRFDAASQNARDAIKPSRGNYVLNRILVNEKMFKRETKRVKEHNQKKQDFMEIYQLEVPFNELNQAKLIWLNQQQKGNSLINQPVEQISCSPINFFHQDASVFKKSQGQFIQVNTNIKNFQNAFPEEISQKDKQNILTKMNLGSARKVSVEQELNTSLGSNERATQLDPQPLMQPRNYSPSIHYTDDNSPETLGTKKNTLKLLNEPAKMSQLRGSNQSGEKTSYENNGKTSAQLVEDSICVVDGENSNPEKSLNQAVKTQNNFEASVHSKVSKITIGEQQMKELGISNFGQIKSGSSNENIFGNEKSIAGAMLEDSQSNENPNALLVAQKQLSMKRKNHLQNYQPIHSKIQRLSSKDLIKSNQVNKSKLRNQKNSQRNLEIDMTKALNNRQNRGQVDTKQKGKNTPHSPRMSTMMNVKERSMRFSPALGNTNMKTINALNSSEYPTPVNNSPSPSKDTQPIWLVNKKPTSFVVNYKSNQGHRMEKLSPGSIKSHKKHLSPRHIITDGDKFSEFERESKNNDMTGKYGKHNIVTIFSEQVEILERNEMINKQVLIQNQKFKESSASNEITAVNVKSNRSLEPASPSDIERNLGSNLQNYATRQQDQVDQPQQKIVFGKDRNSKDQLDRSSEVEKINYGLKELKVGINPRFILQTKGEYKGFKIQTTKKENVVESPRFENLNLQATNQTQSKGQNVTNSIGSGSLIETLTPKTEHRNRNTSVAVSSKINEQKLSNSPQSPKDQTTFVMSLEHLKEALSAYAQKTNYATQKLTQQQMQLLSSLPPMALPQNSQEILNQMMQQNQNILLQQQMVFGQETTIPTAESPSNTEGKSKGEHQKSTTKIFVNTSDLGSDPTKIYNIQSPFTGQTENLQRSPSRHEKDDTLSSPMNLQSIQPALNIPNIMHKIETDQQLVSFQGASREQAYHLGMSPYPKSSQDHRNDEKIMHQTMRMSQDQAATKNSSNSKIVYSRKGQSQNPQQVNSNTSHGVYNDSIGLKESKRKLSSKRDNEDLEQVKIIKKKLTGQLSEDEENQTNVNDIQSPEQFGNIVESFQKPPQIDIINESLDENNTENRHSIMSNLKPVSPKVEIPNLKLNKLSPKNKQQSNNNKHSDATSKQMKSDVKNINLDLPEGARGQQNKQKDNQPIQSGLFINTITPQSRQQTKNQNMNQVNVSAQIGQDHFTTIKTPRDRLSSDLKEKTIYQDNELIATMLRTQPHAVENGLGSRENSSKVISQQNTQDHPQELNDGQTTANIFSITPSKQIVQTENDNNQDDQLIQNNFKISKQIKNAKVVLMRNQEFTLSKPMPPSQTNKKQDDSIIRGLVNNYNQFEKNIESSLQTSLFDSRIQTQRQFKEKPPKYIQKENIGMKIKYQKQTHSEKDKNGFYITADNHSSTVSPRSPSFRNTETMGIRQLVSQSKRRQQDAHNAQIDAKIQQAKNTNFSWNQIDENQILNPQDLSVFGHKKDTSKIDDENNILNVPPLFDGNTIILDNLKVSQNSRQVKFSVPKLMQSHQMPDYQLFQNKQLKSPHEDSPSGSMHESHVLKTSTFTHSLLGDKVITESQPSQRQNMKITNVKRANDGPWISEKGVPIHLSNQNDVSQMSLTDPSVFNDKTIKLAQKTDNSTGRSPRKDEKPQFQVFHKVITQQQHNLDNTQGDFYQNERKDQQKKSGNPFQKVHKGLVSSSIAQRQISKLQGGASFLNQDTILVLLGSPRQVMSQESQRTHRSVSSPRRNAEMEFNKDLQPVKVQVKNLADAIFMAQSLESSQVVDVAAINQIGERQLFTLPTSVVEELRKEHKLQQQDQQFGLLGQQCATQYYVKPDCSLKQGKNNAKLILDKNIDQMKEVSQQVTPSQGVSNLESFNPGSPIGKFQFTQPTIDIEVESGGFKSMIGGTFQSNNTGQMQ